MNTNLDLNRLIFDPSDPTNSNTIGSYTIDGYGSQITSTIISPVNTSLDVFAALADGYGNQISSTAGALNVNISGASIVVNTDLHDGYGNPISSTSGSLNVNVTNASPDLDAYADNIMWTAGNLGSEALAVRHDANTSIAAADGYYAPLQLDAYGRLKVDAVVTLEPQAEFYEQAAHLFTDPLMHVGTVVKTDNAALPNGNNTYSSFFVDGYGNLKVTSIFDPAFTSNGNLKVVLDSVADNTPDAYNPIKVGSRAVSGPLAALSAYDNRADLISDLYRRIYINDSANIGLLSSSFTVGTSVNPLVPVGMALAGRRKMIVQNRSTKSIFVGDSSVSVLAGLEVRGGVSMSLDIGPDVGLFAIAATTGNDIRVFELA